MFFPSGKPGRDYNSYRNNTSKDAKAGKSLVCSGKVSDMKHSEDWGKLS